jgi:hypothetical protein
MILGITETVEGLDCGAGVGGTDGAGGADEARIVNSLLPFLPKLNKRMNV